MIGDLDLCPAINDSDVPLVEKANPGLVGNPIEGGKT
jgi:hypothetical protein